MFKLYTVSEHEDAKLVGEYLDLETARVATDGLQKKMFVAYQQEWGEICPTDDIDEDYAEWLGENGIYISSAGRAWLVDENGVLEESDDVAEHLADLLA